MKPILLILFCLSATYLFAQKHKPDTVIKRDTINIRGYVYDSMGKPVQYIGLESTQPWMEAPSWHLGTTTDGNGYFQINGIKFNDTLTFDNNILYSPIPVYNKGSRYIIIYLASSPPVNLTEKAPITITAARRHKKIIPSFDVIYSTANIDKFELHLAPKFGGGNKHFVELIKQQLQYPPKAIDNNVEGTVTIGFQIEKDGTPVNFKTLQGIGYGCEEELIDIIKRLGKWRPGIANGRPMTVAQTVSVEFKLTDK
jgi:TonB family protein